MIDPLEEYLLQEKQKAALAGARKVSEQARQDEIARAAKCIRNLLNRGCSFEEAYDLSAASKDLFPEVQRRVFKED